jgi:hypothetical protein
VYSITMYSIPQLVLDNHDQHLVSPFV